VKRDARATLLDLASPADHPKRGLKLRSTLEAVWQQRHNARRFVFDHAASARVGEMMLNHVDLLIDNIEFARAPYPTCYFEFDSRAMWREWRPEQPLVPSSDERVGYLVHEGTVLIFSNGKRPNTARDPQWPDVGFGGISFRLNRPQSVSLTKLTGHNEVDAIRVRDAYVFGGQRRIDPRDPRLTHINDTFSVSRGELRGDLGIDIVMPEIGKQWTHGQIAAHFDISPTFHRVTHGELRDTAPKDFTELCFMAGGDPLTLVTLLLLLNQPSKHVAIGQVPREVGLWRGRRTVFKEHHVVTLRLDRPTSVRDIFNLTDRRSPVAHDVMGHWKHYNRSIGCDHHHADGRQAWEPVGADRTLSGDYKRYWCPLCLQRRTWTENFTTGGQGVATTEYVVTR
jgi:hypothetical protein